MVGFKYSEQKRSVGRNMWPTTIRGEAQKSKVKMVWLHIKKTK